jgi:hypothetical protein
MINPFSIGFPYLLRLFRMFFLLAAAFLVPEAVHHGHTYGTARHAYGTPTKRPRETLGDAQGKPLGAAMQRPKNLIYF